MNERTWIRLLALLAALALVAGACGGSSDGDDAEGSDETATASEGDAGDGDEGEDRGSIDGDAADDAVAAAGGDEGEDTGDTDAAELDTIDDYEAYWEANRQAVIDRINDNGWGLGDDGVLTGPAGFAIDTNECPSDWSNTEGIGDTLVIGNTTVLSGNLAAYGNLSVGMEIYYDYVNDKFGGVGGVPIELIMKDDGYVATQTIEQVDELLQSTKPFAIQTLGSPNSLAVYDKLNESCVPHPITVTGHPAWGDPEYHPWTTGQQMSYATEAILWGSWIKNNLADDLPVTVAGLVMDNDFGLAYEEGMAAYAEANPDVVAEFLPIRHDPAAPTVTNEMTTIAADNPDVFISMTAGNPCLLAVEEAARSGMTETAKALFMPSVCKDPSAFLVPAGMSGDGFLIVGGGAKVFTDPQYADDVYVQFVQETIDAAGEDNSIGYLGTGFANLAWPMVEGLRIAAELDGGLNRTNFILGLRAMDVDNPGLLDGIKFAMDGNDDAYFIEGSDFSRYDAAGETWVQEGGIVDLNGSSPNCEWGQSGDAGC